MVKDDHTQLLEQILALLDTTCQAGLELLGSCTAEALEPAENLLADLRTAAEAVGNAQQPLLPQLEYAYTAEMLENVEETLEELSAALQARNWERAAVKAEFQLFPFLRQLREAFYFWGTVYPDKARMEQYYREEFAARYQNLYSDGSEPMPFRLSIAIPAYNHLSTTKQCVEQLLKETDFEKLNAELILIDHGSSDGTLEYFESLGVRKVLRFKRNARMQMLAALFQICQGTYFAFINNDILVTRDWAEILLNCLESDERIISAVPATPNISNLQACSVPGDGPEKFIAWAAQQNRSNPARWNDRARLMPSLGVYRLEAVNKIGFADPYFHSMEYWDDDFSLRARRAGYRQVLCEDVACYHFGSVTGGAAQTKENTLASGRDLFLQKNGVDAWGSGFCYDFHGLRQFVFAPRPEGSANVLGLDCGFGDSALQIRNQLRQVGQESRLFHVITDESWLPDLCPQSAETVCTTQEQLLTALETQFPQTRFDYVFLGQDLSAYPLPYRLLEVLCDRMRPGGQLVCFFSNPYFAGCLHQMLQFSLPCAAVRLLPPEQVRERAGKIFSAAALTGLKQPLQGLNEFILRHYGKEFLKNRQRERLEIAQYYVKCVK